MISIIYLKIAKKISDWETRFFIYGNESVISNNVNSDQDKNISPYKIPKWISAKQWAEFIDFIN